MKRVRGMGQPQGQPTESPTSTPPASPQPPSASSSSSSSEVRTINLKVATREELVDFIKQYSTHTRQLETRSRELYEQCKQLRAERPALVDARARLARLAAACADAATDAEAQRSTIAAAKLRAAAATATTTATPAAAEAADATAAAAANAAADAALHARIAGIAAAVAALRKANDANRSAALAARDFVASLPVGSASAADGRVPAEIEAFRLREEAAALRRARDGLQTQLQRLSAELGQSIERQSELEAEKRALQDALQQNPRPQSPQLQEAQSAAAAAASVEEAALREKVARLQALLAKAKDQFDAKARLAGERAAELARLRGELAAAMAAADDVRARLAAEEDARDSAQDALRALRREMAQRIEALETRARAAEADLSATQEEFRAYKIRAQSAMREQQQAQPAVVQPRQEELEAQREMEEELLMLREESAELRARLKSADATRASDAESLQQAKDECARLESAVSETRREMELRHSRAVSALEAEYSLKYEELREALREHRAHSKQLLDEREQQIASLQSLLREVEAKHQQHQHTPVSPPSPLPATTATSKPQPPTTPPVVALLHLENVRAVAEAELGELRRRCTELESEIAELEHTVQLHELQEKALKEQIRDADRSRSRVEVNAEYLKNIVVRYMQFGTTEHDRLLPVIAALLKLTPEEVSTINDAHKRRSAI